LYRLTLALGAAILAIVPVVLGAWQISTSYQATGIVTIGIGIVLALFIMAILVGYPGASGGRFEPPLD